MTRAQELLLKLKGEPKGRKHGLDYEANGECRRGQLGWGGGSGSRAPLPTQSPDPSGDVLGTRAGCSDPCKTELRLQLNLLAIIHISQN